MKTYKSTVVYTEDNDFPLYDDVEVLVCGGGPSGVAAAETSARYGKSTLLVERLGFLGGEAVAGYSGSICGLFYGSDNPAQDGPKQCVYGWTDKFYRELIKRNAITQPQMYGKTFLCPFDPQVWKEAAEDMLLSAGAKILYHSSIVGVIKEGDAFKGVVIDTKSGLAKITAKRIIDATGDADLIYRAGMEYTQGDNGNIQSPTMIFRLAGVDVEKFLAYWGKDTISPDKVTHLMQEANKVGYNLPRLKVWVYHTTRDNELFMNCTMITGKNNRALNVLDPDDHTTAEQVARKQVNEYARFFKNYIPGCEKSFINDLSCQVGVRQTRSIVGIERLKNTDVENKVKRPDGIVRSPWPIEVHKGEKPYLYWLINDYYEVPYGVLVPKVGENLICCGRNLSAEHYALASSRVTGQCFGYGHAAALASVLSLNSDIAYRDIDGCNVRAELNKDGAKLD